MKTTLKKRLCEAFPQVNSVVVRDRAGNVYATVSSKEYLGYAVFQQIAGWLRLHQYTGTYITSGGGTSATYRINPD